MKFFPSTSALHIITYSVALALVLPNLVQHGMFMDGTQYACVARNLAAGKGPFWFPFLSDSWSKNDSPYFMEHLPFVYFLQSKFFLALGENIYTERIYCFCCLLLSAIFIEKIWKLLPLENQALKRNSWLPLLLWITCGSVFWAYQNNMLEITVTIFVLAAVYFMLKAVHSEKWQYLNIFISGACIFLSSLSKGLPGLFPLTGVILFYFTCRNISLKKAFVFSSILIAVPLLFFSLFYFFSQDAKESLQFYLVNRLFYRVENDPLVQNRLTVLFWLFTDMLLPLAVLTVLVLLFKFKKLKNILSSERKRLIAFFILLGFAGVAPLTLTLVQRAIYFVPALPFFAIGISLVLVNGIEELKTVVNHKYYKTIRYSAFAALSGILIVCVFLAGKTSRDENMLGDVCKICARVPAGTYIDVPLEVYESWDFQFYLLRYNNIGLRPAPTKNAGFYLAKKSNSENPENFKPVDIGLKDYTLFEKIK